MELLDKTEYSNYVPAFGLGVLMLLAGISKFIIPEYWTGYEPQLLLQLAPFTADQLLLIGGFIETSLGLALLVREKVSIVSLVVGVWIASITLQMARLGLWDLAIRDLGLTFYALSVHLFSRTE